MTLFAEPELERRMFGDFRARIEATDDTLPDKGRSRPNPPRMFPTEGAARTWLLQALHDLVEVQGYRARLYGVDFGDDIDACLAALVAEEPDNAVLLGRLNAARKPEYYVKMTSDGVPFFGGRAEAVRFIGYNDPEMARVKELTTFETLPEKA
jgi:hypothetical protein